MPTNKYAPTVNPGDTRHRIRAVAGRHILAKVSSLNFSEEEVILSPSLDEEGQTVLVERSLRRTRNLILTYDPSDVLELRHPETDEPLGAPMPMEQAFAVIYSLGRKAQLMDDERLAAIEASQGDPETGQVGLQEGDLGHPIPEGEG